MTPFSSLIFLLAFLAGLVLCFARGPIWGLFTYVAAFYLHPPSRWWGEFLPDIRWAMLAAVATLLSVIIYRRKTARQPFVAQGLAWIMLFYVAWFWVQTPFAADAEAHMFGAVLFTKYFLLLYLIYEIIDSEEQVRDFLIAHVAGCFYLGWLAFRLGAGGRLEGVGGPGIDDANGMAMHLGTGVVIGAMLLLVERGWRFWFVLLAMPFMLNGMILGNSRGAFVGLVLGGLTALWLKPPGYRKKVMAFSALGVMLLGYLANDFFWERMSFVSAVASGEQEELDFSARSRWVIMGAQWEMFKDHPLGSGHAGTATRSPDYLGREYLTTNAGAAEETAARSSHNTVMSILVDQGVVGMFLFCALLIWAWRTTRAVTKASGRAPHVWGYGTALVAALMVAFVSGQFAPYLKAEVQFWCLALLMSLRGLPSSLTAENNQEIRRAPFKRSRSHGAETRAGA